MSKPSQPGKETPPISQAELLKIFLPIIQVKGKVYQKTSKVHARPAKPREIIITTTSAGFETKNTAKKGDFVITNATNAKEEYIISAAKFPTRYRKLKDLKNGYALYQAIGSVKGIKLTKPVLHKLKLPDHFSIQASWGEAQMVAKGDYMVCTLDESEIYIIGGKEFGETYE